MARARAGVCAKTRSASARSIVSSSCRRVSTESTGAKYRAAFNLKSDHPLVTPSYAAKRSELAKSLGLGRKAGMKVPARKKTGARRAAAKNAAEWSSAALLAEPCQSGRGGAL